MHDNIFSRLNGKLMTYLISFKLKEEKILQARRPESLSGSSVTNTESHVGTFVEHGE